MQGLEQRTFQEWAVRQPRPLGGMGVRSQVEVRAAAFVGAMEHALPSFAQEQGGELATLVGCDSFKPERHAVRWQVLLDSGCRTGQEFAEAWGGLQREAQSAAAWLGEKVEDSLSVPAAGAGTDAARAHARPGQRVSPRRRMTEL